MIESVVVPLIGFLIAVFGVFFDAKARPRSIGTLILVLLLVVTALYSGWSAYEKNHAAASEKAAADLGRRKAEVERRKSLNIMQNMSETTSNMSRQLGQVYASVTALSVVFGIRNPNPSPQLLAQSVKASGDLIRILTPESARANQKVTVQYFPKEIDRDVIEATLVSTLKDAGFEVESGNGNPMLTEVSTNSIWYGENVPDMSIRVVALALTRAGVKIRGIQKLPNANSPSKINLIQIGSYVAVQNKAPYSVEQIVSMQIPR